MHNEFDYHANHALFDKAKIFADIRVCLSRPSVPPPSRSLTGRWPPRMRIRRIRRIDLCTATRKRQKFAT